MDSQTLTSMTIGSALGTISWRVEVSTTLKRFNSLCCPACELVEDTDAVADADAATPPSSPPAETNDSATELAPVLAVLAAFIIFGVGIGDAVNVPATILFDDDAVRGICVDGIPLAAVKCFNSFVLFRLVSTNT